MTKLRVIRGGKNQAPEIEEVEGNALAQKLLVEQHGPRCAAWLVWRFRRSIRAKGYFVAKLPRGAILPTWFSVAIACFKSRSRAWEVEEATTQGTLKKIGKRFFTIRWRAHHRYVPAHAWN